MVAGIVTIRVRVGIVIGFEYRSRGRRLRHVEEIPQAGRVEALCSAFLVVLRECPEYLWRLFLAGQIDALRVDVQRAQAGVDLISDEVNRTLLSCTMRFLISLFTREPFPSPVRWSERAMPG